MRVSAFLGRMLAPTDVDATITSMRVGVVDVGSNTARLLVAEQGRRGPVAVAEAKAYLGLGAEILEHGGVRAEKLDELATELRRFATTAREAGAHVTDVFVTAPGRQAGNAEQLLATVARASGHVARVLSPEEEGELAYEGAVAGLRAHEGLVAVCDVGGGSTEIAVGEAGEGAEWVRSADVGSLRLTAALFADPPTEEQVAEATALVRQALAPLDPPAVGAALAVGGSARALARIVGPELSVDALTEAIEVASSSRSDKLARRRDVDAQRARTLAGGGVILREVARLLDTPLRLGRGGLREGAAARLLQQRLAA